MAGEQQLGAEGGWMLAHRKWMSVKILLLGGMDTQIAPCVEVLRPLSPGESPFHSKVNLLIDGHKKPPMSTPLMWLSKLIMVVALSLVVWESHHPYFVDICGAHPSTMVSSRPAFPPLCAES